MRRYSILLSAFNIVVFIALFVVIVSTPVSLAVSLLGGWACGAGVVYSLDRFLTALTEGHEPVDIYDL